MVGKLRATGVGLLAASGIAAVWNEFAGVHSRKNMVKAAEINLDDIHGLRRHSNLPTSYVDIIRSMVYSLRSPHLLHMLSVSLLLSILTRFMFPGRRRTRKRMTVPTFFIFMWLMYYQFRVRERPTVRFLRTPYNVQLVEKSRITRRMFSPIFWAFNSHVQTALCTLLNDWALLIQPAVALSEERVPAFDGNDVILYWGVPKVNLPADAPVVLLSHGVYGGPQENYVKNMFAISLSQGWRPVLLFRWRFDFHDTRDLTTALDAIKSKYSRAPIFAIGYSAGAHVLLSYLNKVGRSTPLVAAVLVGGAYNMLETMHLTKHMGNPTYNYALTYACKQCVLRHLRYIKEEERAVYAPLLARLSQINDAVQIYDEFAALTGSKLSGMGEPFTPNTVCLREPSMKPREAHYSLAPGEHIAKVGITTLVIHAHDDPITNLSDSYFKRVFDRMLSNPHIVMCTTRRGGHVGWHQNIFPSGPTWADRVASDFLSAVLGNLSEVTFFLTILRNMSKMSEPLVKSPFLLPLERVLSPDGAEPRAYADASAAVPGNHSEAFEPIATLHQRDVIVSPSDADDEGLMIRPANLQRRMSQPLPSAREIDEIPVAPLDLSPEQVAHLIGEAAAVAPRTSDGSLARNHSLPDFMRTIQRRLSSI